MPSQVIVRSGTCIRKMENGTVFRVQRYICQDCRYSFVARPPDYGYGKHYPHNLKEKGIRTRVKTSLRKISDIAEQHFSIQSWLFKHRFKTKEGLLKTSFWYPHYLSTDN
jgi:hypothetical protein